ncbi:hybrid sensor histidine kinase/response regulator [Flavobacterium degerlachei]|jgi:signal transduction histidine kinase/HPt (histidine-containing phosphotransfer) domain-containing protein|uniref:Sensory/regulatory protein RpfC n=1 Tax=Flavobacterium degerlachei TaxID=229203 RepID=A0A1H2SQ78_9FLAO|nr:hybrid sensor histidine kinase/response regulator [Flavobacterium degerlachei]SDW33796.1 Signal transduction histidine kinase [Flavobacterium degerlachei]
MATALKILIIDDDKVDLITINRSISQSGIIAHVENAFSAKEAIKKLNETNYDLIFLDYLMPDSDGISFLRKLNDLGVETPVIFVTSQGDEKIASQAILGGASDYIPKTLLTPDGISQSIRNVLKIHESILLRKKTEQELKINANRLFEAQKLAKIGSWEINLNDGAVFFSEQFQAIFEIEERCVPSLALLKSRFINDEDVELFEKNLSYVKNNNSEIQFSHSLQAKNGTKKYINEYIKCLNDEHNEPFKILGTIQDITDQKQIEEELILAKNLAEQSVRVKEQFLTNMSHEIRTPMNGIIGFARILERTNLDSSQEQSVKAIKRAGKNLMVIINDILDFSKIEADKIVLEEVDFSLSKAIKTVIELLSTLAEEKKVKLLFKIDPEINNFLVGDPTRLSQILINLVGNALKFTEKGSVELIVSQEEQSASSAVIRFTVIDTGIGIPENKIDSIFESFNQASNETTRKFGGTGLGLTITRKLIELLGGSIVVKSELEKGSEFTFSIQYKKAEERNPDGAAELIKQLSPEFLKDINILLVEDNELNQLLAIKIFEGWDKEITVADNGKTAINKIENNDYDVILMDIQMPEMDGNELTKYIRKHMGSKSNIPIIALTAHATLAEEKRCLENGMNDYLSKPFHFSVLLQKLHDNLMNIDRNNTSVDLVEQEINSENLINFSYLNEFADDDSEFIAKMVSMFLNNTPVSLQLILEANQADNMAVLKSEVHKLKSSISLLGISQAAKCIENIENEIEINPFGEKRKAEVKIFNDICMRAFNELEMIHGFSKV